MRLLMLDEVFTLIETNQTYSHLLSHLGIRRHLFYLGGVPRWVVNYLTEVFNRSESEVVPLKVISECYDAIPERYASKYFVLLSSEDKIKLAAYSIFAQMVLPSSFFSSETKWSKSFVYL
eukprot:TRINITY_DN27545_c0_g1_i4.p1 TRINITY_DN27545_c0_g1~~TRINITY_DN27545_c0_g1_i4.p1  ORF type:complete len:120 (-),score=20.75 TRINITY_DN27545_c0_g1_i4:9-368(-)